MPATFRVVDVITGLILDYFSERPAIIIEYPEKYIFRFSISFCFHERHDIVHNVQYVIRLWITIIYFLESLPEKTAIDQYIYFCYHNFGNFPNNN